MNAAERLTKLLANPEWRPTRVHVEDARNAIVDLQAAKIMELSDAQVVAMFGGQDAADEAASHAGYVARVAIREASAIGRLREIQQTAAIGLSDTGCVEGDMEHLLFTDIHRMAVQAMSALQPCSTPEAADK